MWIAYAFGAAILWGLNYSICEEIIHRKISIYFLLFVQYLVGIAFFGVMALTDNGRKSFNAVVTDKKMLFLFLGATITYLFANLFICLSIKNKNASLTALIEICYPIFTILSTWLLFHKYYGSPLIWVGAALIFIGASLVLYA